MSTQAALEEEAWTALLDVNKHRLEAHSAADARHLAKASCAFDDIITAARAGKAALEAVGAIREDQRKAQKAAGCKAPVNDCQFFPAADDQCRWPALRHHEFCDRHQFHGGGVWSESHELADCCRACCEGAVHTVDGVEVIPA